MRVLFFICLIALVLFGVWMAPVFLMGFPVHPLNLDEAWMYLDTGALAYGDGHFSTMVLAWVSRFIAWDNLVGWTVFAAASVAVALIPFWWSVRLLFNEKVALLAILIFGLMPIYFQRAITLTNYSLSYVFLFLSGGLLVCFFRRRQRWILIMSGVLFGLSLGFKEAYVLFVPWMIGYYLWMYRMRWKSALSEIVLFFTCAVVIVALPVLPEALRPNQTIGDRLAVIFSLKETKPIGEFYPDQYTYDFDREWYENLALARRNRADLSFFERVAGDKRLIFYNIGDQSILFSLFNGFWLLLNRIPSFFFVDTVGGVILWLFIVPGGIALFRSNRMLFWFLIGLMVTSEIILRFVLHFQRIHLMDYGWILVILAALGVVHVAEGLKRHLFGRMPVVGILAAFLVLHLLQMNRVELGRLYLRSVVPRDIEVARVIRDLPDDALIAIPKGHKGVPAMSGRDMMIFREETIERLLANGKLVEAFRHYGVTHVLRYPDELAHRIRRADPRIVTLNIPEGKRPEVTPMMKYLLNLFR